MVIDEDNICNLEDCFQSFFQVEEMKGENKWDCDKCLIKRKATRSLHISRLPNTLFLHMKKFKHDKTSRRKLNSTFIYPIQGLELPMCYLKTKNQNFTYNLKSVLCHVGDLDHGHYYSYI